MSSPDQVIGEIRQRVRDLGYTLDPRIATGQRIGPPLYFGCDACNVMGGYDWPRSASMLGPGNRRYRASVAVCRGPGHGGVLLHEEACDDFIPFQGTMSTEEFVEMAAAMFRRAMEWAKSYTGDGYVRTG